MPTQKSHISHSVHHQNLWSTRTCFPGPDDAPRSEMCDFHMDMVSWYNLNEKTTKWDIALLVLCHKGNFEKHLCSLNKHLIIQEHQRTPWKTVPVGVYLSFPKCIRSQIISCTKQVRHFLDSGTTWCIMRENTFFIPCWNHVTNPILVRQLN